MLTNASVSPKFGEVRTVAHDAIGMYGIEHGSGHHAKLVEPRLIESHCFFPLKSVQLDKASQMPGEGGLLAIRVNSYHFEQVMFP